MPVDRSAIGRRSKQSGNAAEQEFARLLSDWSGHKFRKCPASGALRWNDENWTYGDLVPPAWFPFVFESKKRKDGHQVEQVIGTTQLSDPSASDLVSWYWQVLSDSYRAQEAFGYGFVPVLLWKRKGGRPRFTSPTRFFELLENAANIPQLIVRAKKIDTELSICDFKELLSVTSVPEFLAARKAYFGES